MLQILRHIATLDFKVVKGGSKIQVFEVIIRHLGAMISAWDLLNGPFRHMTNDVYLRRALYNQMIRLGDVLSCGFDARSGIPHDWVDPMLCQPDDGTIVSVATAGTVILEFGRLSDITGNRTYVSLARRAEEYLLHPSQAPYPGLVGSHVSVATGQLVDQKGSWGAFADCKAPAIYQTSEWTTH